jgi:hypothetical protein
MVALFHLMLTSVDDVDRSQPAKSAIMLENLSLEFGSVMMEPDEHIDKMCSARMQTCADTFQFTNNLVLLRTTRHVRKVGSTSTYLIAPSADLALKLTAQGTK